MFLVAGISWVFIIVGGIDVTQLPFTKNHARAEQSIRRAIHMVLAVKKNGSPLQSADQTGATKEVINSWLLRIEICAFRSPY